MSAINYALTATTDFLQQLVIAKVTKYFSRRSPHDRAAFFPSVSWHAIIGAGVTDPRFRVGQTKPSSKRQAGQTSRVASAEILLRTFRKLPLLCSRLLFLAEFLESADRSATDPRMDLALEGLG